MKINNFSIFKVKEKKSEKSPDYRLSTKIGEEFVEIGGGWIKESKAGKYISCKLSEPYGARDGFHIEIDKAEIKPVEPASEKEVQSVWPKNEVVEASIEEDINIPF